MRCRYNAALRLKYTVSELFETKKTQAGVSCHIMRLMLFTDDILASSINTVIIMIFVAFYKEFADIKKLNP